MLKLKNAYGVLDGCLHNSKTRTCAI